MDTDMTEEYITRADVAAKLGTDERGLRRILGENKTKGISPDGVWAATQVGNWRNTCIRKLLPFNLETVDILPLPVVCPVLDIPLAIGGGDGAPRLDLVDRTKGCVKGNVVVVSALARRLRGDSTPGRLVQLAKFYWPKYKELQV